MTVEPDLAAITEALFASAEKGDWHTFRSFFSSTAMLRQNVGHAASIDAAIPGLASLTANGTLLRYENVRRFVGDRHVTELHDAVFNKPDGTEVRIDICVVLQFDDAGLIERADEYLDAGAATALFAR